MPSHRGRRSAAAEEARAKKRARLADATISDQQAVEAWAIAEVLALVENAEREVAIAERKVAIAIEIVQLRWWCRVTTLTTTTTSEARRADSSNVVAAPAASAACASDVPAPMPALPDSAWYDEGDDGDWRRFDSSMHRCDPDGNMMGRWSPPARTDKCSLKGGGKAPKNRAVVAVATPWK